MSKIRLSVIVPGYNTPDSWWKRCLESVLRSIGPDDEIICVDDASPKKPRILDEFVRRDSRVIPIYLTENGGQGRARNLAVQAARGEWIAYVDSDDEVLPDCYRHCFESLQQSSADVVLFGVKVVWPDDGLQKTDVTATASRALLDPVMIQKLCKECLLFYPWNKIYNKGFLEQHGITFDENGMPCEDQMYNLECARKGARWNLISDVGYVYYRSGNTSLGAYKPFFEQGVRHCSQMWTEYLGTLSEKDIELLKQCSGEKSETSILSLSWGNIWRNHSAYSLKGKYRWLLEHKDVMGIRHPTHYFIKYWAFKFLRKHFYLRPIRRWHIRRLFPNVEEVG